jgi:hypothetical protein
MKSTCLAFAAAALMALGLAAPSRADLQKAQDDRAIVGGSMPSVLVDVLQNDGELGPGLRLLKAFKPAHGSATVENGRIRYTPNPGFQGSDSFKYMVQAEKSQPGQATVSVEVGRGGVSMRLQGQVVDSPIPGAVVTVSIGGYDFKTVADANGNYVLDIASLQGDAFVTLTATGTSTSGEPVKFYSLVGEIVRLNTAAGSDGVLTRDEFNQVNVTNLSTAQYSLLTDANGGVPPTTDEELLPLVQNIDLDKLLELAAIIKLVVDEGVPLPAGSSDLLALISDPAAVDAFKDTLAPGQLEVAVDEVVQDPNLTPGFHAGAIPASYVFAFASAPGTIRVGLSSDVGSIMSFNADGTGQNVCNEGCGDFTWALDNGDLVGTPVAPHTFHYPITGVGNCPNAGYEVDFTVGAFRLHRLQDGAGVDYLEVTSSGNAVYYTLDPIAGCSPPPNGLESSSFHMLAFEEGAGEIPFAANESFGKIGLNFVTPNGGRWGAAIFDFDAHAVTIPEAAASFSSSVANGRLYLDMADAATGQPTHYEYRRYQMDGSRGEGMLMIATLPDGRKMAGYNLSSRVQPGYAFDLASMPGTWRSGFDASQFQGESTIFPGFYIVINGDAARTGNQRTIDANGNVFNNAFFGWNVGATGMIANYWKQPGTPGTLSACPAGSLNCYEIRRRTWEPLGRAGNRIYVLENIVIHDAPNQPWDPAPFGQRVNFFELP